MPMEIESDITNRSVRSISAAIGEVEGFINDVRGLIAGESIAAAEGEALVDAANELRVRLLGCLAEFKCGA
jgi:hypothetical protein